MSNSSFNFDFGRWPLRPGTGLGGICEGKISNYHARQKGYTQSHRAYDTSDDIDPKNIEFQFATLFIQDVTRIGWGLAYSTALHAADLWQSLNDHILE